MPEPNACEFEMAIEEVKEHKSLGIDRIPAELIKARSRIMSFEIH